MDFKFLTLKDSSNITKALLTCFLETFYLKQEYSHNYSKSQLSEQLKAAETARRPSRGFQVVIVIEKENFPKPFENTDFLNWSPISKNAVFTPKRVKSGSTETKEYPYRTLVFSNTLLRRFLSPKNTQSTHRILEDLFGLSVPAVGAIELAIPSLLFVEGFIQRSDKSNKLVKAVTPAIEQSIFPITAEPEETTQQDIKPKLNPNKPKVDQFVPPTHSTNTPTHSTNTPTHSKEAPPRSENTPPQSLNKPTQPLNEPTHFSSKPTQPKNISNKSQSIPQQVNPNPFLSSAPTTTSAGDQANHSNTQAKTSSSDIFGDTQPFLLPNISVPKPQGMNNFQLSDERATKGYKSGYEFPLKGLWNPDDDQGGTSIEEIIDLLKLVKEQNQYRTDQALITAFLSENKQIKLYLRLTAQEKVNLDAFTSWLRHYKEEDTLGFMHKFRTQKQGKLSFRSFALELERLYRNAKNIPQDKPLDQAGQDEITMTFRRNIRDPRIKMKITSLARTTPMKELVTHCEFISSNMRDMYHHMDDPEPITGRVQLAAHNDNSEINSLRSELAEMQKTFAALLINQQNTGSNPVQPSGSGKRRNLESQSNYELTCANCNATNHNANQCDEIHRNESFMGKEFCRYCKKLNHTVRNCYKLQARRAREVSQNATASAKPTVPPRQNQSQSRSVAQFLSGEFNPLDVYSGNS